MFPEMRMFSKSASAKKLTDGKRYSCSATLPRWSFSLIIVFDLRISEGWKLGSLDTHYMQGSGIFSRFSFYSFLSWRKHFLKIECDVAVFWCPDTSPTTWLGKTEERAAKSVWDVLRYQTLEKTAFDIFGNVVFVVLYCVQLFWWFSHKPSEKYWAISPKAKHKIPKKTLTSFQKWFLSAALLFSLVVFEEKCFENFLRTLYLEQYVFFVHSQSHVSAALVFERYVWYFGSLYPAFEMSCDIEYLWTAFVSRAKRKLSKTTVSTFQKCLCELWWAFCFGCK